MTDPNAPDAHTPASPTDPADTTPGVSPVPPPPPAYDGAPYVAPAAPSYDTEPYPSAYPSAYDNTAAYPPPASTASGYPTYPTAPAGAALPPYGAAAYGTPAASPYGAQPVQSTPGAPPVVPYGYGAYAPARRTNGLSIAAMVLSILGFVWILPLAGSIAGAIMGHISLGQIKRTGEGGRGMALAGVIVGYAGLALLVLGVLFFVFIAAVSSAGRYS